MHRRESARLFIEQQSCNEVEDSETHRVKDFNSKSILNGL